MNGFLRPRVFQESRAGAGRSVGRDGPVPPALPGWSVRTCACQPLAELSSRKEGLCVPSKFIEEGVEVATVDPHYVLTANEMRT